jgi:hypothetical protein
MLLSHWRVLTVFSSSYYSSYIMRDEPTEYPDELIGVVFPDPGERYLSTATI